MKTVWTIFRYNTNDDYKALLIGVATTAAKAYELLSDYKNSHNTEDAEYEYTVTPKALDTLCV